jgi:23S rRNA pseudouridine1911/1915/1917 synthase
MPKRGPRAIPILHEDEDVLVVDKPAGMLVVHAPGRERTPTVVDRLGAQLGHRVYAVHRLDEDVTGVLALAARPEAREPLEQVFRGHGATRLYLARTARMPDPPAGRIESKLHVGRDGIARSVTRGPGERAVTDYECIKRCRYGALLAVRLETGRRNQIRAHLAELGCPIVGDRKYGYRAAAGHPTARHVLLHAWRLAFPHPRTGVAIAVEAPPPAGGELDPEGAEPTSFA